MARSKVRLDRSGIKDVAKSAAMHDLIRDVSETVAENARAQGIAVEGVPGNIPLPVSVQVVTTDRAHGIVALAHPSGNAVQAKHGLLTKAAAEAGLDVRSR